MSRDSSTHDEPPQVGADLPAAGEAPKTAPTILSKTEQQKILDAAGRLTPRQRQLIYYLTEGMTLMEAGERAGYAPGSASTALANVRNKMPAIMDRLGLADEILIQKYLMPLLEAYEVKTASYLGDISYSKPLVALDIRLRALDLAFKVKGSVARAEDDRPVDNSINVNIIHVGGGA